MIDTILYFGSFNPVHRGHIAIIEYLLERGFCEQLWMVVSPHNPLKEQCGLVDERDRLAMAEIAARESKFADRIKVSDIEFSMPRPSYTIDTLAVLEDRFKDHRFSILIGSDNIDDLDKWKDYEQLMDRYKIWVYPRVGIMSKKFADKVNILTDAPLWNYSSTEVRQALENGCEYERMVCKGVEDYIIEKKLWITEKFCKPK